MKYPLNLLEGTTPGNWQSDRLPGDWGLPGAYIIHTGDFQKPVATVEFVTPYPIGARPQIILEANVACANARLIEHAPTLASHLAEAIELLKEAASMFDNHEDAVTGEVNPFREFLEKMEGERG